MTARRFIWAHEYVECPFANVLEALEAEPKLLGVEPARYHELRSRAARRVVNLPVRIDGVDAILSVIRVVGGTQEPVTELILGGTAATGIQPPPPAASRALDDVVAALQQEPRAASGGHQGVRRERREEAVPRRGRPRALIESRDLNGGYAIETMLRRAGFDTELCGGPEELPRHRCPLLATGACVLVERADVIIHALDFDRAKDREVLRAIRTHYPETPVVVQIPAAARQRHRELLRGCSVVENPMIRSSLLGAVETALERGRGWS